MYKPQSQQEFLDVIQQIPSFLKHHPDVRLIVIDSITYYLREMTDMLKRYEIITRFINQISSMTIANHIAVSFLIRSHIDSHH